MTAMAGATAGLVVFGVMGCVAAALTLDEYAERRRMARARRRAKEAYVFRRDGR